MKPVFQTIFDLPKANCLQACVASVFELDLDAVPNFAAEDSRWFESLIIFCSTYGLFPLLVDRRAQPPGQLIGYSGNWYSILGGISPRGDFGHSIVLYNGTMVHDPHPSAVGIINAIDEIVFIMQNPGVMR